MSIEGKYILPNGEVLEVHINVAVNTWKNGEWSGFNQCTLEEFKHCMNVIGEDGEVVFQPKEDGEG